MTKAKQLFPLTMRPGIKRDGSPFQSEYCINGDWVRWQKGMPRSMNGMITPVNSLLEQDLSTISGTISILAKNQSIWTFAGSATKIYAFQTVNKSFDRNTTAGRVIADVGNLPLVQWQPLIVKRDGIEWLLFYGCPNKNDTAATYGEAVNYSRPLGNSTASYQLPLKDNLLKGLDGVRDVDGGAVYAAPFLFLYGTNGTVRISRQIDCFDFRTDVKAIKAEAVAAALPDDKAAAEAATYIPAQIVNLTVSDKVVYAAPIRGGSNSPTLLFWTLSSLIRLSNITTTSDILQVFKPDPISISISILSPKCVIEYDGLFFWMGTDRPYVYNGNVSEIPNTVSIDYFYKTLDRSRAAEAFGVKMPRYGEIWYFYPRIGVDSSFGCTGVIIYNKRENSWYDTTLPATAAFYASFLGKVLTWGRPKVPYENMPAGISFLWLQDTTARGQQSVNSSSERINSVPIQSSFTTPYFSFAAFNPLKQQVGEDHQTIINRLEPCFISPDGLSTTIGVTVNTLRYPQSTPISVNVDPILINVREEAKGLPDIITTTERIDMAIQGGNINLTFTSTDLFEMGHSSVLISLGDGNR